VEIRRAFVDVDGSVVVLAEVVSIVLFPAFPVNAVLVLSDTVLDPVESHINGAGVALPDVVVGEPGGGAVVGLDRGRWLRMAHLRESVTEGTPRLAGDIGRADLHLKRAAHDGFEDPGDDEDATVCGVRKCNEIGG